MRSSWVICVDPKSNDNCSLKRHSEETVRKRGNVTIRSVIWSHVATSQEHLEPSQFGKAETCILLKGLWREYNPPDTLILDFWAPRL